MASSFPQALPGALFPAVESRRTSQRGIYQQHCHRVYSLAFWITDNELAAEQLAVNTFLRVFTGGATPENEQIDAAFLAEVRELMPVGCLTLRSSSAETAGGFRRNVKRVHLERAVVELPVTERLIFLLHDVEGYSHEKIGRLLGITERGSKSGLHEARLRVRALVSCMS